MAPRPAPNQNPELWCSSVVCTAVINSFVVRGTQWLNGRLPPKMAAKDQIEIHMAYLIQIISRCSASCRAFIHLPMIKDFGWRIEWFMNHAKNKYLLCLEVNRHQEKTEPTVYHPI